MDPQKHMLKNVLHSNLKNLKIARPGFHFGATPKTRKVMAETILYERYRDILFQKVALDYLLHFVRNESSKHVLKHLFVAQQSQTSEKYTARLPSGSTNKT